VKMTIGLRARWSELRRLEPSLPADGAEVPNFR
jgi:hypothetical protein